MEEVLEKVQIERYPAYKHSGIEWLGEIPEHWSFLRGNYVFEIINERSEKGTEELLSVSEHYGVRPRSESNVNMFMAESYEGYKMCYPGDLVINSLWAWSKGLGISKYHGIISTAYSVYRPDHDNYDKEYLNYLLRTEPYVAQYLIASKGVWISRLQLSDWSFLRIPILSPPKHEQTAIAAFLNRKTSQIDNAISIKERQIELLQERRQILIQNAVTRGLDPKVKMKDSGVEWIGEIPELWEVRKLKYLFKLVGGGTPSKERREFWNGSIPWVSPKDMKTDYIYSTEESITEKGLKNSATSLIEANTLLMVVRSGILQRKIPVAISKNRLSINQDMKAFIQKGNMSTHYLFHFVQGNDQFLRNDWVKQGATVESIEVELMRNGMLLVPPQSEQIAISEFVENISLKIATAIILKEKEIEKLKEYKATLINEAVTGKVRVRWD